MCLDVFHLPSSILVVLFTNRITSSHHNFSPSLLICQGPGLTVKHDHCISLTGFTTLSLFHIFHRRLSCPLLARTGSGSVGRYLSTLLSQKDQLHTLPLPSIIINSHSPVTCGACRVESLIQHPDLSIHAENPARFNAIHPGTFHLIPLATPQNNRCLESLLTRALSCFRDRCSSHPTMMI